MREQDLRTELDLSEDHPEIWLDANFVDAQVEPVAAGERPYIVTDSELRVDVRQEGATTRIILDHSWGFLGLGAGHGRIHLHVPKNISLRLHTSGGRLRAENLHGCRMAVQSDAGEIVLRDVHGLLKLVTEAGRIDGTRVGGTFDVRTSAGSVRLEILELDPGVHRVQTSVGAQRLELARGMPVWVEARATMGSVRVKFPTVKGAPAMLDLGADLGAIKVSESHEAWVPSDGAATPYRAPPVDAPVPIPNAELDAILRRVAEGSLSPADGAALLRSMGHR